MFYPEPCTPCDSGLPCEDHGTLPRWTNDWLTHDDARMWR